MEDSEIVKGIKSGNEDCFVELVNRYKKKIISLCYSYTQDYGEAEDISQEIFINVYKNIVNFKGESSLSTYIYRISVNKCIDYKRKKSIKNFLTGLISFNKEDTENLDEKAYVRKCITSLPESLRLPIVLYYYVGLSQKEIANVLGTSEKAIEGRIYRAKNKLKDIIETGGKAACKSIEII